MTYELYTIRDISSNICNIKFYWPQNDINVAYRTLDDEYQWLRRNGFDKVEIEVRERQ